MVSKYNQLAPVVFGAGAIEGIGNIIKEMACKKVLCVYDSGVKAAGLSAKVEDSLRSAGVHFVIFDKIASEPPCELIDEGGAFARENSIDCIIGVGGGSSMDAAKAIGILMGAPSPIAQYLTAPPTRMTSPVPIVLVPTTSGTGSEVTQVAVLSNKALNAKMGVFIHANLAVIDPELTRSVPPKITAMTGLDALSHAVESITAKNWNPRSEVLALAAIRKIAAWLPVAYKDGSNMQARTELCLASNWAGIAFADTDVHFGHAAADGISAACHTPHGLNCAWVTPEVIELVAAAVPGKVQLIGEALGLTFNNGETAAEMGSATAQVVRRLMRSVDIQSMREMGFTVDQAAAAAGEAMQSGLRFNTPVEMTNEKATQMLKRVYVNYV